MPKKNCRRVNPKVEKRLLRRQSFKCANSPGKKLHNIGDYECLLWKSPKHLGHFDQAGYQVDHIQEFCKTGDNHVSNLQLLCPQCHAVKSLNFQDMNVSQPKLLSPISDLDSMVERCGVFRNRQLNDAIYASVDGTDTSIAAFIRYLYQTDFCHIADNATIDKLFRCDLTKYHRQLLSYYSTIQSTDDTEQHHYSMMRMLILETIEKLKSEITNGLPRYHLLHSEIFRCGFPFYLIVN